MVWCQPFETNPWPGAPLLVQLQPLEMRIQPWPFLRQQQHRITEQQSGTCTRTDTTYTIPTNRHSNKKKRLWWWFHNHRTAKSIKAYEKRESCWTLRNPDWRDQELRTQTTQWVLSLLNACARTHRLPRLWRHVRVVAFLKPGKDPSSPKSFIPIYLLCHLSNCTSAWYWFACLPLSNMSLHQSRLASAAASSCTAQVLNLTQHYRRWLWDMENHRQSPRIYLGCLWHSQHSETDWEGLQHDKGLLPDVHDSHSVLENRRFFVELDGERSLPQGSVLAPLLFNVYITDQPIHLGTRSFVYADDLVVTTQSTDFAQIEKTLTSALVGLSEYSTTNQLRANPTRTQVSLFHLRNRECCKQLNISWIGVNLIHCNLLEYTGVTQYRTLSY